MSDTGQQQIEEYLNQIQKECDSHLDALMPKATEIPVVVHEAMRYSVFAGGKRFRPALVVASGEVFNAERESLFDLACGIELIHTYSLIHDDLPCMDDDDLRRGKPTLHKVYGDGVAVLAGDALYALAFEIIARCAIPETVEDIARATGTAGMIGGQVADITLEGEDITPVDLDYIHNHKTGSLITACLTSGARNGEASAEEISALKEFGRRIGLAFQIVDDVLDETGSTESLGKKTGADQDREKNTYPKIHGLKQSVDRALELVEEAKNVLVLPGRNTIILELLADFVVHRVM
jgi:geranylgeranyl diphosphate synthase type II